MTDHHEMRLALFLIPALCGALGACDEFPELDGTIDSDVRNASYIDLVPIETITSEVPDVQITPEVSEDLDTRVERLKKRAKRLDGAVVDSDTQARMDAGIEPPGQ